MLLGPFAGRTARSGNGVYAATKWGMNGWSESLRQAHRTQPGDPAKAARALLEVVESGVAPYMLLLGNDASDAFRAALDALREDVEAWDSVSRSTDF